MDLICLDLGSPCDKSSPDLIALDILSGANVRCDLTMSIPFKNNSADEIMSNHFLEHIGYEDGILLLRECYRVLKSGGKLTLATPELVLIFHKYLGGLMNFRTLLTNVYAQNIKFERHVCVWVYEELKDVLKYIGFKNINKELLGSNSMKHVFKHYEKTYHGNIELQHRYYATIQVGCYK